MGVARETLHGFGLTGPIAVYEKHPGTSVRLGFTRNPGSSMCRTFAFLLAITSLTSCNDSGLYAPCEAAKDCEVPDGREAACVKKDSEGFCSWKCSSDSECKHDDEDLLCASFEENMDTYCFPACGTGQSCPDGFTCRSTGGGVNQRNVCFPN
jgi:hypothetical protein